MNKNSLGKKGEDIACRFLEKRGFRVIERNLRTPFGEIDIIAKKGTKLYFVEVKTRKSLEQGLPVEAVSRTKKDHIINSIYYYLKGKEANFEIGIVSIIDRAGNYEIEYISDIIN